MARIRIENLPRDIKISKSEMKMVKGGGLFDPAFEELTASSMEREGTIEVVAENPPTDIFSAKKNGRATVRPYDL